MAVCEKEIPASLPGPPSGVVSDGGMTAEPFADKDFSGGISYVQVSLRYRRHGISVGVGGAVHIVYLLGAVVKCHRVGVTCGLEFLLGSSVL